MATHTLQSESRSATSEAQQAWADALANYHRAKAAYDRASADHDAAMAAAEAECDNDQGAECERYGLKFHKADEDRNRLIRDTEMAVTIRDYPAILEKRGSERLTEDDFVAITRKAVRLVDAFAVHKERVREANARIDPFEKAWEAALDALYDARAKMFATPAPDAEAFLFKMDTLSALVDEHDGEDKDTVAHVRNDAKQLLAA